jgi:hypothetical protein
MQKTVPERYPVLIDGETALVGNAAELAVVLDVLQGEHDRAVLEQLAPHLPAILVNTRGLQTIMRSLVPADQFFLVETLAGSLAEIITDAAGLRDLLAMLAEREVEEALLHGIGGARLRELATSPRELADLLEWVYGESDGLLLDMLGKAHLNHLFTSGTELAIVLSMLGQAQQRTLIEILGWQTALALIHNRHDLMQMCAVLPASLSAELLNRLPAEKLRALVRDFKGWRELTGALEHAEIDLLRARLEVPYAQ